MTAERRFRLSSIGKGILSPLEDSDIPSYRALLDALEAEEDDHSVLSEIENCNLAEDHVRERRLRNIQAALAQNSAAEAAEKLLPSAEAGESKPTLDGGSLEAIGINKGHVRALAVVAAQQGLEATDGMIAELAARRSRILQAKAVRNQSRDSSNDNSPLHATRGAQKQRRSDGN